MSSIRMHVNRCLEKILKNAKLTYDKLLTAVVEVE